MNAGNAGNALFKLRPFRHKAIVGRGGCTRVYAGLPRQIPLQVSVRHCLQSSPHNRQEFCSRFRISFVHPGIVTTGKEDEMKCK